MNALEPSTLLARVQAGENLSRDETATLFDAVLDNRVEPELLAEILRALAAKGETVDEIVGAALAMRRHATPVRVPTGRIAIDTCGTGGDGKPLFNVSSTVAIVVAACGVTVAKHGNRSNARPSGSAEALSALGIHVEADVATLEHCLEQCNLAFLYAAKLHPAMRFAAPVRRSLGIRTIFNLVGPLSNPAGVRRQLLGVNRCDMVEPMLAAVRALGAERALVVCGEEGLCDISVAGPTLIGRWDGVRATIDQATPESFGFTRSDLQELRVDSPEQSAGRMRSILQGVTGAARDIVLANASAALWVAGACGAPTTGVDVARRAIDSGAAEGRLSAWIRVSNGPHR